MRRREFITLLGARRRFGCLRRAAAQDVAETETAIGTTNHP
jgi:hypothetical protein